jgi:hypothetical protein
MSTSCCTDIRRATAATSLTPVLCVSGTPGVVEFMYSLYHATMIFYIAHWLVRALLVSTLKRK